MEAPILNGLDEDKTDDTSRLAAFSDGVFSVAITLLVLNIQVPHLKDSPTPITLMSALLSQWPTYLSYVISFFTIGVVWANHHRTFKYIMRSDHNLRMLNLFLLMTVTLIPFTSALLSEYIQQPEHQQTAAFVYGLGWLLLSIAYNLVWRYAVVKQFIDPRVNAAASRIMTQRVVVGLFFYSIAVIVALFSAVLSVAICLVLVIFYLIPTEALPGIQG